MADAVQRFRPWLLLVEDEAPLAEAIRLNLENEFELAVAGTVEEARVLLGARAV